MIKEERQIEAKNKLLEAAAELMKSKAPSLISGRELAREAGVNYGLVHHYYKSKYGVFQDALQHLIDAYVSDLKSKDQDEWLTIDLLSEHEPLWRIMAQFALDDEARAQMPWTYPILRREQARIASQSEPHFKEVAALNAIFTLGWVTFSPLIKAAYELTDQDSNVLVQRVTSLLAQAAVQNDRT